MITIDMCGKIPITGGWIYRITWKHVYFNIFVVFIVRTTTILKLVFPTIVFRTISALMVTLVAVLLSLLLLLLLLFLFIYFFIYFSLFILCFCFFSFTYSFIYYFFIPLWLLFLVLLLLLSSLLLLLLLESSWPFVCVELLLLLI